VKRQETTQLKNLDGQSFRIGVVTALFNRDITKPLEDGAVVALLRNGVDEKNILSVQVPGAFEIPLAAKFLLQNKNVDGIVALGAVIRGETTHYDYVCAAAERGCSDLALEFVKPVSFGVLTTENLQQAQARAGGSQGNKGYEAAEACLEMCNLLKALKNQA
jgi:6,7-dimethyl-8-ribityllumazine synthase